jgi:hypothetical protein
MRFRTRRFTGSPVKARQLCLDSRRRSNSIGVDSGLCAGDVVSAARVVVED